MLIISDNVTYICVPGLRDSDNIFYEWANKGKSTYEVYLKEVIKFLKKYKISFYEIEVITIQERPSPRRGHTFSKMERDNEIRRRLGVEENIIPIQNNMEGIVYRPNNGWEAPQGDIPHMDAVNDIYAFLEAQNNVELIEEEPDEEDPDEDYDEENDEEDYDEGEE